MGRFDTQNPGDGARLGEATKALGSTLEREIADILQAANDRAAAIEQEAMQQALESARVAGRRDKENRDRESERLAQLLERLDRVEGTISGVLNELRQEIRAARADLANESPVEAAPAMAPEPPVAAAEPPPPPEPEPVDVEPMSVPEVEPTVTVNLEEEAPPEAEEAFEEPPLDAAPEPEARPPPHRRSPRRHPSTPSSSSSCAQSSPRCSRTASRGPRRRSI